jgi:ABC-type uncharacterized transport system auxiliary subunit
MRRWLKIFLPIFFIGACASPETRIYSLYVPMERGTSIHLKAEASLAIWVDSPRYLTQPYIVYRKSPYQLEISRYSKWDASPDEKLRELLKEALSSAQLFKEVKVVHAIPQGFYSLKINLKKFERSDEGNDSFGEILFDVSFISPGGKELYQDTISRKLKLGDRTFLSLAKGLSFALKGGGEEVKTHIDRVLKENP